MCVSECVEHLMFYSSCSSSSSYSFTFYPSPVVFVATAAFFADSRYIRWSEERMCRLHLFETHMYDVHDLCMSRCGRTHVLWKTVMCVQCVAAERGRQPSGIRWGARTHKYYVTAKTGPLWRPPSQTKDEGWLCGHTAGRWPLLKLLPRRLPSHTIAKIFYIVICYITMVNGRMGRGGQRLARWRSERRYTDINKYICANCAIVHVARRNHMCTYM